jgi:hypothetical protein
MSQPPPRLKQKPLIKMQLNQLFESEAEMRQFVKSQMPGTLIIRHWPVQQFACIVLYKPQPKGTK